MIGSLLQTADSVGGWGFLVGGAVLLTLELVLPGFYLFWVGLAAATAGAVGLLAGLSLAVDVVLFATFAIVAVYESHRLAAHHSVASDAGLNERAESLVGQRFLLAEPIENGSGRIRVGDTLWRVRGGDQPAGEIVTVSGVRDGLLWVASPATGPAAVPEGPAGAADRDAAGPASSPGPAAGTPGGA